MLKNGRGSEIKGLPRIFNWCIKIGTVSEDWKIICIVSKYKNGGDKGKWANYSGISILSIPKKLFGSIFNR